MDYDRLARSLHHLGLNDANYKVLKLLPLVYVAWSNGKVSPEQEERILILAHEHFQVGDRGEKMLREWIRERPTVDYFHEGLKDIFLLAHAPDDWRFDLDELQGLLSYSEGIARSSAQAMDAPTTVSPVERQALRDIASELGIDNGESWAELLDELDSSTNDSTSRK